jgi:DEAD/DEAH box helicase domain-containing protein
MKRSTTGDSSKKSAKKQKVSNATTGGQGKEKETSPGVWPEHFHDVSPVFVWMNFPAKSLCHKLFKVRQIELTHVF